MNKKICCEKCCYYTNKNQDYEKHITTKKHTQNKNSIFKYDCKKCNKKFTTYSGSWRHNKNCNVNKEITIANTKEKDKEEDEDKFTKIMNMISQNNQNMISTMKNMITELVNTGQLIPTPTNINSHNKIDINVFLNEKCKNAINMSSLIEDIMFGIKDVEAIGKHGYVKAITDKLVNKISGYSVYERPIHYFIENGKDTLKENEEDDDDQPQETIHIKENNKWNTEEPIEHDLLLTNMNTINDVLVKKSQTNERINQEIKRGKRYDKTGQIIKNVLQSVELNEQELQLL